MRLYLVQHGEARAEADDPERPLTAHGVETVGSGARWASRVGVKISEIHHSGKRRAEQTAEILARHLKPERGVRAVSGLGPHDDVGPWAPALASANDPLMLVGHLPFLSRLTSRLVVGSSDPIVVRFANAGIVCLSREHDTWCVEWALTPRLMT